MSADTIQRADRRIHDALDELKRKYQPEDLTSADIAAIARCLNGLRSIVARVRSVTTSETGLSGWGPLASRDRPDDNTAQTAASSLREVLDGILADEDPAALDPAALRLALSTWHAALDRVSWVLGSRQLGSLSQPLRGWTDDDS
jgi:hypothetical protein